MNEGRACKLASGYALRAFARAMERRPARHIGHTLIHSRAFTVRLLPPGQNSIGTGGQNSIGADNTGCFLVPSGPCLVSMSARSRHEFACRDTAGVQGCDHNRPASTPECREGCQRKTAVNAIPLFRGVLDDSARASASGFESLESQNGNDWRCGTIGPSMSGFSFQADFR